MTIENPYRPEMLALVPANARRVLDVGCADGSFGASVKSKTSAEVWGVDLSSADVSNARLKLDKVIVGPIDANETLLQLPDGFFDAICFNDVLEHLIDPDQLLNLIRQKLTPQGVIVAAIPNVRYFRNLSNLLFKKEWKYEERGILDRTHLRFYTKKSMRRLFEEQGFEILFFEGINATLSFRPYFYHIFSLGLFGLDTKFLQFAIIAKPHPIREINNLSQ